MFAPTQPLAIKICGLSTPETLEAALAAGVEMIGLVFHPKSPRFVPPEEAAALAAMARGRAEIVALVVDRDIAELTTSSRPSGRTGCSCMVARLPRRCAPSGTRPGCG